MRFSLCNVDRTLHSTRYSILFTIDASDSTAARSFSKRSSSTAVVITSTNASNAMGSMGRLKNASGVSFGHAAKNTVWWKSVYALVRDPVPEMSCRFGEPMYATCSNRCAMPCWASNSNTDPDSTSKCASNRPSGTLFGKITYEKPLSNRPRSSPWCCGNTGVASVAVYMDSVHRRFAAAAADGPHRAPTSLPACRPCLRCGRTLHIRVPAASRVLTTTGGWTVNRPTAPRGVNDCTTTP